MFTSSTTSKITLSLDPVNEGSLARSYYISWRNLQNVNDVGSGSTDRTTYTAHGLQSNTAYHFTVTARNNEAGYGETSEPRTFATSK